MSLTTSLTIVAPQTDDYVAFCGFLRRLTGVDLSQYKRPQMERRLRSFYASRGITDLTDAFIRLRTDPSHLNELLDRITINVSQLWRNPSQWEFIEHELIPDLVGRATGRTLRAWSAGCSYGAEAYTLATVWRLAAPDTRVTIEGTDIDKRMVQRARSGLFTHEDARTAPAGKLAYGFEETTDGWQAKRELQRLTSFAVEDLLQARRLPEFYDLILCRNTVIYFAQDVRDAVHARLISALRPGGYLVIGSTERVSSTLALGLVSEHPFIYRKA